MPGFLFYYRRSVCRGEHLTRLPYFPKKRKVADNQHIINHLPRAENGNRTLGFFPLCINMLQRSLVFQVTDK